MPSSRQDLIRIQKTLVEDLKERIYGSFGRRDAALDRYYREYQQEFRQGFERPASREEVLDALHRSSIAYFGDYHTLYSAQSAVLSLLHEAAARGRKIVLALEILHAAHQPFAYQLVEETISPEQYREAVGWDKNWGFSWKSFGRFFEFAREHGAPLFGINISADYRAYGLEIRDEFGADLISALTHFYPERMIAVVYGDLHLAGNHLPARVDERLRRYDISRRSVRIYQNSETVYWHLVGDGLEHVVDYMKIRRNVYCILNATPLVKFQSFEQWQSLRTERLVEGLDGLELESPGEGAMLEQVAQFIRTIAEFLGIELEDPENFELTTAADFDFLETLVERGIYSEDEMAALKDYIAMAHTAFFTRARLLYLGNLSVANAAEAAARFILSEQRPVSNEVVAARDEFYARIMVEALAFFCSKIIDQRRKPKDISDWRQALSDYGRKRKLPDVLRREVQVARAFIRHKEYEAKVAKTGSLRGAPSALYKLETPIHVGATRALGRTLGEALYHAVSAETVGRARIRDAIRDDIRKPDASRTRYFAFLKQTSEWL